VIYLPSLSHIYSFCGFLSCKSSNNSALLYHNHTGVPCTLVQQVAVRFIHGHYPCIENHNCKQHDKDGPCIEVSQCVSNICEYMHRS
jgi:hypothetical protein